MGAPYTLQEMHYSSSERAEVQRLVLDKIIENYGMVIRACDAVGVPRRTIYEWRDEDPDFEREVIAARRIGAEMLENEGMKRAVQGYKDGNHYSPPSDLLTMFLLKGIFPERYRDNYQSVRIGIQGNNNNVSFNFVRETPFQLAGDVIEGQLLEAPKEE